MILKEDLDVLLLDMELVMIEKTISIADKDKFGEALCACSNDFFKFSKARIFNHWSSQ